MSLAAWWRGDALPELPEIAGMTVHRADDAAVMAVNRISRDEVQRRRAVGSTPYVAAINGQTAAYGWSAAISASIGEVGIMFTLTPGSRYLWDFKTLPEWQGRGIYPRLLQAIIRLEAADRYWILYAPENQPSATGIERAGFTSVGLLSFQPDGTVALIPDGFADRARAAAAALLGVPLLDNGDLSPCWRCAAAKACDCHLQPEGCTCAVPLRTARPQNTSVLESVMTKTIGTLAESGSFVEGIESNLNSE